MIYLNNDRTTQEVFIPRNGDTATGSMTLVMRHTIELDEVTIQVEDQDASGLYFSVSVDLPEGVTDGEYQYRLIQGDNVLSCGLLIIGHLDDPSQYGKTITYKQYESE